jgi:RimJ/RimL family protein N-acetyltransferase
MYDYKKINWEKLLREPGKYIKPFDYAEEKILVYAEKLLDTDGYLPDELRYTNKIGLVMQSHFSNYGPFNMWYEIGEFGGIMGFTNILPEYKCLLDFKLWNTKYWCSGFLREARALVRLFMNEFHLHRISTDSADERMVKMAKKVGFKTEAKQKNAFKFNGNLMTNYLMRFVREDL